MRGEGQQSSEEGRHRSGVASPFFEAGKVTEKGGGGVQDKSRPSQGLPSVCLHIVFSRDSGFDHEILALVPQKSCGFPAGYLWSDRRFPAARAH